MATALAHLTLNTGHTRQSPRGEVGDGIIAALAPLVAAGGGHLPAPGQDYRIDVVAPEAGAASFTVARIRDGLPLVTCFCCWQEARSAAFWGLVGGGVQEIAASQPDGTMPSRMPPRPASVPWLAVLIWPTLALAPDAVGWLGDLERCVAWTLIAGQHG